MKIAESTCLDMQAVVPGIPYSLGRRHVLTLLVGNEATTTSNPSWKMSHQRCMWKLQPPHSEPGQACSGLTGLLRGQKHRRPLLNGTTPTDPKQNIPAFCLWRKLLTEVQRYSKYLVKNGFPFYWVRCIHNSTVLSSTSPLKTLTEIALFCRYKVMSFSKTAYAHFQFPNLCS